MPPEFRASVGGTGSAAWLGESEAPGDMRQRLVSLGHGMHRRHVVLFVALALAVGLGPSSACAPPQEPAETPLGPPPAESSATTLPSRSEEDVARDEARKPQAVMDLLGVAEGTRVAELMSGSGYYVDQLARRVGTSGHVWAHNTPFVSRRYGERLAERLEHFGYTNVTRLDTEIETPELPAELDAVMIALFYHDLYWQKVDRKAMLQAVFEALRPGGVLGVIDHAAAAGHAAQDVKTLHRIEEALVTSEVIAAGFELQQRSDLLARPNDRHDTNVFDADIRGATDRFVLVFRKPAA